MGIEDITLREVDDEGAVIRLEDGTLAAVPDYHDKVMRLRVVKDNGPVPLNGDKLFIDIMEVYEDFDGYVQVKVGSAQEYHETSDCGECEVCKSDEPDLEDCLSPTCVETEGTTSQKCLGSMEFNLDEVIDALLLLKKHAH